MRNIAVQRHSLNELMHLLGEVPITEGLHVIEEQECFRDVAIQYPFRSDHFSLMLVNKGEAKLRINLTEYSLSTNELMVIPPNAIRQFIEIDPDSLFTGIAFTAGFLSQSGMNPKHATLFNFFSTNGDPNLKLQEEDAMLLRNMIKILKELYAASRETTLDIEVLNHSFLALLYKLGSIHRKYNGDKAIRLTKKEGLVMQFTQLLTEHFREERSVLYYAEHLYVTPRHLTQTVKEITNRTAGEMIDQMVVTEAKVLLSNLSFSVGQVAEALYFSDQFFFSKFFKKHSGFTPSEYRKTA